MERALAKQSIPPGKSQFRILVAEDSDPVRTLLAAMLRSLGYDVTEARDGEEAYRLIVAHRIQLVVSDWLMPRVDGPSLCRKLRQSDVGYYVYFMLVTVRDSHTDLVEGMDAGADDFLGKPVNLEELRVRLRAGQRVLELERVLAERNQRLTLAYGQIRRDVDAAAQMQRSLLPEKSLHFGPAHFEWLFVPSMFVSGDDLNAFRLDDHHVGFYNLDVAGHGVPAAMMSVTLSRMLTPGTGGLLRESASSASGERVRSPSNVAAALNAQFQITAESSMYFTLLYGVLNTHTGVVRFIQAGHTRPMLLTAGDDSRILDGGSPPIGVLPQFAYEEQQVDLQRGERLVVYSDGVTECENVDGVQFGEERLLSYLSDRRDVPLEETLQALVTELNAWRSPETPGFPDDLSVLALEFH